MNVQQANVHDTYMIIYYVVIERSAIHWAMSSIGLLDRPAQLTKDDK